ncbi:hypothetical protein [Streptomyces lavendulae]|uniref:hypothetical protein n=1 Tax=Streptomyces lavendulae TaxID=1914 RepID=UPI00369C6C49
MWELTEAAVNGAAEFIWDKVLGDYIAGILTAATVWMASKVYRRRRRLNHQEQSEE